MFLLFFKIVRFIKLIFLLILRFDVDWNLIILYGLLLVMMVICVWCVFCEGLRIVLLVVIREKEYIVSFLVVELFFI